MSMISATEEYRKYYADSAFSSNKCSQIWKQQSPNKSHTFSGMFAMAFGDIRHVIPHGYIDDTHDIIHAPMDPDEAHIPFSFDHEKICTVKGTRDFFRIICTLGGYMSLILGGGFVIRAIGFYVFRCGLFC